MLFCIPYAATGIITLNNERVILMAKKKKVIYSPDEILEQAARLVAGAINPSEMGLTPEQVDVEQFVIHFKTKAAEMWKNQDVLNIAIGPYVNVFGPGVYSNDVRIILDYVEEQMQMEFDFYYGLLISLDKKELHATWQPH